MVEIRQITTAREKREFLSFPLTLYRDNPCFVPPLWADEKKIFRPDYVYNDVSESVFYGAYRDGVMVGRISGILSRSSNEKWGQRRVRFTRFDAIDDTEVSDALFAAVEEWALAHGMDTVAGPLGYSDLEREGLLVEGFDVASTFEEQYNAAYYGRLIEHAGYGKETDWLEFRLRKPQSEEDVRRVEEMADYVMKRYRLHVGPAKNVDDFLDKYADGLFELLDKSYDKLYGTVPFTPGMRKMLIDNFRLIVDLRFVAVILDEQDRVICLAVCFPAIGEALRKSGGHLTPGALVRLLRAVKKPKVLDLGLIGVEESYLNRGVTSIVMAKLMRMLEDVDYAETNLNLEDNYAILNCWKRFDAENHKRRRSYVKRLGGVTE